MKFSIFKKLIWIFATVFCTLTVSTSSRAQENLDSMETTGLFSLDPIRNLIGSLLDFGDLSQTQISITNKNSANNKSHQSPSSGFNSQMKTATHSGGGDDCSCGPRSGNHGNARHPSLKTP